MIKAEIIADSLNEYGNRITTFVVTFPRIILAEINTHRMFSRNSASSRAIPFEKMVKMVEENPFIPIKWMKDHKGMQGNEYFTENEVKELFLKEDWLKARNYAVEQAKHLSYVGLTKQVVNRLLEPFMWHTAIITSTEWENFFALRAHEAAEIHLQFLANEMLLAYNNSEPVQLKAGEWHIPFGKRIDEGKLLKTLSPDSDGDVFFTEEVKNSLKVKIATARCARVSYMNFDGSDDYEKDIQLHDNLSKAGHWSPFEHCAKAMSRDEYYNHISGEVEEFTNTGIDFKRGGYGWSGNFRGFVQYRKTFENENKNDTRVVGRIALKEK